MASLTGSFALSRERPPSRRPVLLGGKLGGKIVNQRHVPLARHHGRLRPSGASRSAPVRSWRTEPSPVRGSTGHLRNRIHCSQSRGSEGTTVTTIGGASISGSAGARLEHSQNETVDRTPDPLPMAAPLVCSYVGAARPENPRSAAVGPAEVRY
jgi:hypothetical protein